MTVHVVRRRSAREAAKVPFRTAPMLATLVPEPFHRPGWIYEEKYDGIRILAYKEGSSVTLQTRNGIDRAARFPAIAAAIAELPAAALLVDGELVAVDPDGVSRFQLLQRGAKPQFVLFDCLYFAGRDLRTQPLRERREVLATTFRPTSILRLARRLAADGLRAYGVARDRGLEGIVAKNSASTYEPARSREWLKVKLRNEEEFVIGGYTAPAGAREHLGALLLGAYDASGRLRYVGKVGTGFTRDVLADLAKRFRRLVRTVPPFTNPPREPGVVWVAPQLVAQIAFHEWTRDQRLRHPAYLGLREDKSAKAVRLRKKSS